MPLTGLCRRSRRRRDFLSTGALGGQRKSQPVKCHCTDLAKDTHEDPELEALRFLCGFHLKTKWEVRVLHESFSEHVRQAACSRGVTLIESGQGVHVFNSRGALLACERSDKLCLRHLAIRFLEAQRDLCPEWAEQISCQLLCSWTSCRPSLNARSRA